ncbi:MAG: hypothetical protein QMD01_01515 [Thermodesulfovibrionales bacterium]|nr:hypothetical protein [Thermodesulfovibrionales bacterium]
MIKLIAALLFGILVSNTGAENITPYGDTCPLCGEYGYCKKQPTSKEIANALESYYSKKGFSVIILKRQNGRFIEAEVYRNNEIKDRILLDCKTGKLRSIY